MTNKRLVWYLKKEKKIDDRKFGFRKWEKHNRCNIKINDKNPRWIQKEGEKQLQSYLTSRKPMIKLPEIKHSNNQRTQEYRDE